MHLVDGLILRTFFRPCVLGRGAAFRLFLFTSWDQVMNSPPQPLPPYQDR